MTTDRLAAAELDALLRRAAVAGRWPDGFTTDDVLGELMTLGRVRIDVRDAAPLARDGAVRFCCVLELRDEPAGSITGEGRTLTAAALRCLLDADAEVRAEMERVLDRFGELLRDR
jgi:hypothetical protein